MSTATATRGLTGQRIWRELARASFAVISHLTPTGEPRSSGVVYAMAGRRMYVAVAIDSWKARHIERDGRIAVTVPVRRGGLLALLAPIPPATISFHASATVLSAQGLGEGPLAERLAHLVPPEQQSVCRVVEIRPEGHFVTYGVGVPLLQMRRPRLARARVPVD